MKTLAFPIAPARRPLWISFAVALLVLFASGITAGWMWNRAHSGPKYGMAIAPTSAAMDFRLMSHQGQPVSLSDFRGQLVLLYFGYTTCPDICPTTLAEVHRAMDLLGTQAKDVNVAMITVDPDRDTTQVLSDYMTHFDRRFIGLRGSESEVREVATKFGVYFARRDSDSAVGYLVDHTATLMLIDRNGKLRLVFPHDVKADQLAADLRGELSR